jgi:hypothetical protein
MVVVMMVVVIVSIPTPEVMVVVMMVIVELCKLHISFCRWGGLRFVDCLQHRRGIGNRFQQLGERISPQSLTRGRWRWRGLSCAHGPERRRAQKSRNLLFHVPPPNFDAGHIARQSQTRGNVRSFQQHRLKDSEARFLKCLNCGRLQELQQQPADFIGLFLLHPMSGALDKMTAKHVGAG